MQRLAWVCLLAAVMACGEPDSPTSPSTATAAAALSKLDVDTSVLGGEPARATVTLNAPAPAAGVAISLTASGTSATVPASVTVPAGATTATFDVATTRVATTTDVTITAQAGTVTRTALLKLRIDPTGLTPSTSYTIEFSGLLDNLVPVPTYTESGFTVSRVSAEWVVSRGNGNPVPFLQFTAPGGRVTTGELRITAGGAPFWLRSVDFYSRMTRIPYVIEGFLSAEPVFVQLEVVGNPFFGPPFVRVFNARADAPVDVLLIRLSNAPPLSSPPGLTAVPNPMGIDNIVLNR